MFSGIVEESGTLVALDRNDDGARFTIEGKLAPQGTKIGDSIANNGCCLTVVGIDGPRLQFDLLEESLRRTNLGDMKPGSHINLERSLKVEDRIGGHFVTGHVDGTGRITKWEKSGADYVLEIEVAEGDERYLVSKGCIAVDGISLTVASVEERRFVIWIIPHTREVTALHDREVGDRVNLEFDLIAKYTEKLLAHSSSES